MSNPDVIEEENAKRLPWIEGVDAIISGHSHKVVLAEVNHLPIIQAGVNGTHLGKLNFEVKTGCRQVYYSVYWRGYHSCSRKG